MTAGWQMIDSAPKDGRAIHVKRVYQGGIIYEGPAAWRKVRFGELHDPRSGERFAEAYDATGWMYPDHDKRVPEPTHWKENANVSGAVSGAVSSTSESDDAKR